MKPAICTVSTSRKPIDVTAGAPRRIPLVTSGWRESPGTILKFVMMPAFANRSA